DGAVAEYVAKAAGLFAVPGAGSFSEIARAYGIDPAGPAAVFVALSEHTQNLTVPDEAGAEPVSADVAGLAGRSSRALDVAVVLRCEDPALAKNKLSDLLSRASDGAPLPGRQTEVAGVTIHEPGEGLPCYFVAGGRLIIGNSPVLVHGIAERLSDPMPVRYGTPACPAGAADEIAALVRTDRILASLDEVLPGAPQEDAADSATRLGTALRPLLDAYAGADPVVVTFHVTDGRGDLVARTDLATHPALAELSGAPQALSHPYALPATTSAFVTMALSDAAKRSLEQTWLAAMPEDMRRDATYAQVAGMVRRIVALLGDEVTVAAATDDAGRPALVLMAALADENEVREFLLTLGLPPTAVDSCGDVGIMAAPAGALSPVELRYSLCHGTLVAGTAPEHVRRLVEGMNEGSAGGLAAALVPPLDVEAGYCRVILVKGAFLCDVALPLAGLVGGLDSDTRAALGRVASGIHEIRWTTGVARGWREGRVAIGLASEAGPNIP
ncbi:MAG: hypothetical protein JXR94_22335, partial [Candidatus Hydrogenedentes bacterium]|nr:hypothetical protein [Candidatus Hydrogenedentota bacterium]